MLVDPSAQIIHSHARDGTDSDDGQRGQDFLAENRLPDPEGIGGLGHGVAESLDLAGPRASQCPHPFLSPSQTITHPSTTPTGQRRSWRT